MLNLLGGTIKQIDSETLPAVAALANGVIKNAATLLDGMLTNAEACVGDAITDIDGLADRKLEKLEQILAPVNQIVSQGLHLHGTIGGIPVDLTIDLAPKKE